MRESDRNNRIQSDLKNVCGTFEIEGMKLSPEVRQMLEQIATGKVTYQQALDELVRKYEGRDEVDS